MKRFVVLAVVLLFCASLFVMSPPSVIAAEESESESVRLPILMYHSVLKSRKGRYIVSPAQLESDIAALSSEGYVSVLPSEVIAYVEGRGAMPQKPVMLTFDDGYYNNLYYALPILQKYGYKAVINVVGKFCLCTKERKEEDNPNYAYLSWENMRQLIASGLVEIGNHTFDMHSYKPRFGISKKQGETEDDYIAALREDVGGLNLILRKELGVSPCCFAFPFGAYNETATIALYNMGFKLMLTCNEGISVIRKGNAQSLFLLKRYNREGDWKTATVLSKIK